MKLPVTIYQDEEGLNPSTPSPSLCIQCWGRACCVI